MDDLILRGITFVELQMDALILRGVTFGIANGCSYTKKNFYRIASDALILRVITFVGSKLQISLYVEDHKKIF